MTTDIDMLSLMLDHEQPGADPEPIQFLRPIYIDGVRVRNGFEDALEEIAMREWRFDA